METLLVIGLLFASLTAQANRESAGIGVPRLFHRCYDVNEDLRQKSDGGPGFQIDMGKTWPKYEL